MTNRIRFFLFLCCPKVWSNFIYFHIGQRDNNRKTKPQPHPMNQRPAPCVGGCRNEWLILWNLISLERRLLVFFSFFRVFEAGDEGEEGCCLWIWISLQLYAHLVSIKFAFIQCTRTCSSVAFELEWFVWRLFCAFHHI